MSAAQLPVDALTKAEAARIMRDTVRDESYKRFPLGQDVASYLRFKRKELTKQSYASFELSLDKLVKRCFDLRLQDFEPPTGTTRVEEALDHYWGDANANTYNKHLSIWSGFFDWAVKRGHLHGDPCQHITRAKKRDPHRETFTPDQRRAIIASQEDLRDRICCRLLLDYALRKGGLNAVQFKHFDYGRRRLTVFLKRGKVRELPIPQPAFWTELERLIIEVEAEPHHYLLPGRKGNRHKTWTEPHRPLSTKGTHDWWYRCLTRAGVVAEGTTKGERMHKARHTAGQRLLDATGGNLKAVQKLLGHDSISTTADIYVDWDLDALAASLTQAFDEDDE